MSLEPGSFDYVIVGAGSAGCVLAHRLSADPSTRVLLLEAGARSRSLNIKIPAAFPKQFHTKLDWDFWTEPEPHVDDRSLYMPRGKGLGGSSSMNADVPATAPWTVLSKETDATIYYAGSASIDLFSSDTANYRDNLADGEPRIWVALRRQEGGPELELTKVTADPTEGEAMFESGCDVIGTVPMPPDIASWIAAFVDQFHVERAFIKRKRDRAGGERRPAPEGSPDEGNGRP